MKELPVVMVAITDSDVGQTVTAMLLSLQQVKPYKAILFTPAIIERPEFDTVQIPVLGSAKAYNQFVVWKLYDYLKDLPVRHILLIQHDGYVLDANAWTDEFLAYDYIGAPWRYTDGRNVGNGGFSLRSMKLHQILASDRAIRVGSPEDEIICRLYRGYLEQAHDIQYAPEALAHRFSYEMHPPKQPTFGFHNYFWEPYKEPIILSRPETSMGDLIMMEPVMHYYHERGYRVILDVPSHYMFLFHKHYFPIEHPQWSKKPEYFDDMAGYRKIDLSMAYEIQPDQLVLKSYFEACGIRDYTLSNAKLTPQVDVKLFKKYAVLHCNHTDMPYRNAKEVRWWPIVEGLEAEGYTVLDLGGTDLPERYRVYTANLAMLAYIIGGADLFIGSDSGPSQIAAACGVRSLIMFGSVNPKFRYHDLSNITPITLHCEFAGCYHNTIGTRGTECVIDVNRPPCSRYTHHHILQELNIL